MGHVNLVCWHWPNLVRQFGLGEKCLEKEKEKCREGECQEKHREEKEEKRRQLEEEKEEKRQRFEEERRLEKEEKDEKRRREDEEIETRRQEQELSRLEMEAEVMRQKEAAEAAKRTCTFRTRKRPCDREDQAQAPKPPCLLMVRTPWTHICRGLRDLQIQPSGIKLDGHQSSVFCCLDEHSKCIHVYLRKQLRIMMRICRNIGRNML